MAERTGCPILLHAVVRAPPHRDWVRGAQNLFSRPPLWNSDPSIENADPVTWDLERLLPSRSRRAERAAHFHFPGLSA